MGWGGGGWESFLIRSMEKLRVEVREMPRNEGRGQATWLCGGLWPCQ